MGGSVGCKPRGVSGEVWAHLALLAAVESDGVDLVLDIDDAVNAPGEG